MIFKVKDKEYQVKFAYKPTIKGHLLKKAADIENEESMEALEKMLDFAPEMLLIGLQYHHADDFGYDYVSGKGQKEALAKVEDLVSEYADEEGGDITELFSEMEKELLANGFLRKAFAETVAENQNQKKK